ncbi:hypothetical protein K438DRAFT_1769032 [Mycena galopus ATCC 62051]|nr:hypothetical protein K438DRAFT_1769032 [Mycena galopus ATCC 62051]
MFFWRRRRVHVPITVNVPILRRRVRIVKLVRPFLDIRSIQGIDLDRRIVGRCQLGRPFEADLLDEADNFRVTFAEVCVVLDRGDILGRMSHTEGKGNGEATHVILSAIATLRVGAHIIPRNSTPPRSEALAPALEPLSERSGTGVGDGDGCIFAKGEVSGYGVALVRAAGKWNRGLEVLSTTRDGGDRATVIGEGVAVFSGDEDGLGRKRREY